MGEYAEMMLDGTCCASCGQYLGQDAGYPIYCAGCAPDFIDTDLEAQTARIKKHYKPWPCSKCAKRFRAEPHLKQHLRDRHGEEG